MSTESTSLLEALPLPKLECYYDAVHNRYWIKTPKGVWSPRIASDVKLELEMLGYNTKPAKGKTGSEADLQMANFRNENEIAFAGEVAGKQSGLHEVAGLQYLVTKGPKLIVPRAGDWSNIQTLGTRLFGDYQFDWVLSWSHTVLRSLYRGETWFHQMLVLAGPAGCGKSFWQEHVVSGILGGRSADPMQYMSGTTAFNEDIIRAEHLKMEDRHSKTDLRSRRALGAAIKELTVNGTQRAHGKGKTAMTIDSQHWVTLSLNDEAENLSILPPMDDSLKDKIALLRCNPAINTEWPGEGKNEELERRVAEELPAFVHYLLEEYKITKDRHERWGRKSYQDEELMARLGSLSPEEGLDIIITKCLAQVAKQGGRYRTEAADLETMLHNHPELGYRAKRILTWDGACGVYLERLAKRFPDKYVKPKPSERPRMWTVVFHNGE